MEIWENLGLAALISEAASPERSGSEEAFEAILVQQDQLAPLLPDVGMKELDLEASTCWYLWWQRQQAVRNEQIAKPARTSQAILALTANFFRAQLKNAGIRRHRWERPKKDYIKLNVDAGFKSDEERGVTGAVLRVHHGVFLAGSCFGIDNIYDASSAEARALKDGPILAGELGCSRLVVNSDCLEVVSTMQDGGNSIGPAAAIYEECTLLAFTDLIFEHFPRESNVVAHTLTSHTVGSQRIVWLDDPPDFISPLLVDDVSLFPKQ